MDTLILQYDDRDVSQFSKLMSKNQEYAKKLGYKYLFIKRGYTEYPPYWRKVFIIRDLLALYSIIIWVDTDAAIVSNESIEFTFKHNTHISFSENPRLIGVKLIDDMQVAPFCAGVFAIRNTPEAKTLLEYWIKGYDKTKWKIDIHGKWVCAGLYAGKYYEQGAFQLNIFDTQDFSKWCSQWDSNVMNYLPKDDHKLKNTLCPNTFAIHYWGGNRKTIPKHFY